LLLLAQQFFYTEFKGAVVNFKPAPICNFAKNWLAKMQIRTAIFKKIKKGLHLGLLKRINNLYNYIIN